VTFLSDAVVDRLRDVAAWPALPPDRYTLVRPIGRGGMGTVYEAYDARLDRRVAVKVSNAPAAAGDLEAHLRQEAFVLARLEHPGIVPVHDAGLLDDGRLYYVMKLVVGATLADHAQTLDGEAARLAVFERVTETVAFAHAAGIVHRDLQPANVMAGSFGEVLVLDWGAARLLAATGERAGTRVGTPGFMAPEQARGDAALAGPAADVYSLGALLRWLLDDGAGGRMPKRLAAIAAKCVADDPRARYATAADLAADLARYRAGAAVTAHRETVLDRVGRWLAPYRTFILLIAAYLVMRALIAFWR